MSPIISISIFAICTLSLVNNSLSGTIQLSDVQIIQQLEKESALNIGTVQSEDDSIRKQRSPQFGDDDDDDNDYYGDYSDGPESRHLGLGHNSRKKHKKPLLLGLLGGHGGCRGHGCNAGHGSQPSYGGYNQGSHNNQGGSFATASAGSVGGSPHYGGGQSQANAQSASFNFGPYSATFSVAQASAGNRGNGIREYYDY